MPVDYADEVGQGGSRHDHEEGYVSCWGYIFTLHCAHLNCGLCFIHVVEVFILTVVQWRLEVECILDEWQTDKHTDIQFSAAAYHDKYSARLKTLNDFNDHTKEANNVPRLHEWLPKSAWCVTPISR